MNETLLHSLWIGSALVLVLEGFMPFLNPVAFRRALLQMAGMSDQAIRMIGFFSMISGLALLYWVN